MTQQSHYWAYTPRKPELKETHVPPMFIAALLIIARSWKQPRCPSADEWIRKLWYIHTMEYYSAIKKNIFESVLMRWMKLEPIIQSKVSQKEKHQYRPCRRRHPGASFAASHGQPHRVLRHRCRRRALGPRLFWAVCRQSSKDSRKLSCSEHWRERIWL